MRHRLRRLAASALGVVGLVGATACSSAKGPDGPAAQLGTTTPGRKPATFADVDAAMTKRVTDDKLPGGAVLVVQKGQVVHRATYGDYQGTEVIPVASASKWLTSATIMTLVDEGKLSLDAPVGTWLPSFATGDKSAITLRMLLSHTSGVATDACIFDRTTTLEACADKIAARPVTSPPGKEFNYGNAAYSVAARAAEVAGGKPFADLFAERIAAPLGMTDTRFDEGRPTANPMPAASGTTTLGDYAKFLELMLAGGTVNGRQVLSKASVDELITNQTRNKENPSDEAVRITGILEYGLGMWLDKTDLDGRALVASGSGSLGFYPWIDREKQAYGIVEVADAEGGDGHAVRASQKISYQAIEATPRP